MTGRGRAPAPGFLVFVFALALLLAAGTGAAAQGTSLSPPEEGPPATLPDRPTAYLVTVGRGAAVWERFGHNLIWIHDPEEGTDLGYNYGLFSFEQENFLLRFIRGQMEYWMGGIDARAQMSAYSRDGRSVVVQELDLPVEDVEELQAFLQWNERPENRFYRYDYYRDNCSTRVRDALDRVLDGRLGEWARSRSTDASYRDHTLRMTEGLFWISAGMHFGLGPTVDPDLTLWEAMFIPMELRDHLVELPVRPGASSSLVRRQWTHATGVLPEASEETPRWLVGFAAAGLVGTLLFLGLGRVSRPGASGPWSRRGLLALAVPWLAAVGILGTLIACLWAFTDHVGTHRNVNLLYATPLHLVLAFLWPLSRRRPWARRTALRTGLFIAALTLLGLLLQSLPFVANQVNGEFVLLLVPTNLALAVALWWSRV